MNDDKTFLLEEYRSLRKEIELYLTKSRSQERYTLIAVGAIRGWLVVELSKIAASVSTGETRKPKEDVTERVCYEGDDSCGGK
jgi:hypothetical protein